MRALSFVLLAGCFGSPTTNDVVGPFTGASHRFVVDGFTLPVDHDTAKRLGGDLDGNGLSDNQAGMVIGFLEQQGDITDHASDMIGGGSVRSHVEILADALVSDDHVGVLYFGADDDQPIAVGGRFDASGVLVSNRTRDTRAPGQAHVRLPVFRDADPVDLTIDGMEIDLVPDGTGYIATIHGAIRHPGAVDATIRGLQQLIAADPTDHLSMWASFDQPPRDGVITDDEIRANSLLQSLLYPDLELFDGDTFDPTVNNGSPDALSIGFQVHLRPALADAPFDACFDRVRDGDETDVDCGGSCRACTAGATCTQATDCETGGCDAGRCRAASCSDGLLDGFESDVDCGGACAATAHQVCADGQHCKSDDDCGTHSQCDAAREVCVHAP